MKTRKAPTFLGQDRMEGDVVHLAKVINEIVKFNPNFKISSLMADTVIISEHLEQIQKQRQFALRPKKINDDLEWLYSNNRYYSDLSAEYERVNESRVYRQSLQFAVVYDIFKMEARSRQDS